MKCGIQLLQNKRSSTIISKQKRVNERSITIGRATNQHIFLADLHVALNHARLRKSLMGEIFIESLALTVIEVNGRLEQKAGLQPGDEIIIGPYRLMVQKPPEDLDLLITVEEIERKQEKRETQYITSLQQTSLNKRHLSWAAILLSFTLFLFLPLFSMGKKSMLAVLPTDKVWQSGPFSRVHRAFGDDCSFCHKIAFEQVTTETCITCHQDTAMHVKAGHTELKAKGFSHLGLTQCSQCHKEHNGTDQFILSSQRLCVNCHENLSPALATTLDNVRDFMPGQHPQFKPTLRKISHGQVTYTRTNLDRQNIQHDTGLTFSHALHLRREGMASPDGPQILQCNNCHQLEHVDDKYMRPLNFEKHCGNCHRLNFDPLNKERRISHGSVEQMLLELKEYYAYWALQGGYQPRTDTETVPRIVRQLRKPTVLLSESERKIALDWSLAKANEIAKEFVDRRNCSICHQIEDIPQEPFWKVASISVSQRWLEKGSFNHSRHRTEACESCHQADHSTDSHEVLLSGIETCFRCHGGEKAKDKYVSSCVVCHAFHNDKFTPYQQLMVPK